MLISELTEKFLDFEERYDKYNLKYKECEIWIYVRAHIFWLLCSRLKVFEIVTNSVGFPAYKQSVLEKIKEKTIYNPKYASKRDVLIVSNPRKIYEDNTYRCIYFDLLDTAIKRSHYVWDRKYDTEEFLPQKINNLLRVDIALEKAQCELERIPVAWLNKNIIYDIEKYFSIKLKVAEKQKILEVATMVISQRKRMSEFYSRILVKISPKVIVLNCYYNENMMLLCECAKKLNIPTIELQHGVIGKYHIPYHFRSNGQFRCLPDYIFTFGQYDKSKMRFPIPNNRIISVGFPALEDYYNRYSNKTSSHKSINLLFVSSNDGVLEQYVSYIVDNLEENYSISYKIHPAEKTVVFENKRIKVIDNKEINIYECLSWADIVIGTYTTVLMEAVMFDKKVLVINSHTAGFVEVLYESKSAILVDSKEELLEKIINIEQYDFNKDNLLWEKDSLNKMIHAIEHVISENLK